MTKVSWRTSEETEKQRILEKICRMCRIIITELHGYINQLRITLTPALPIHNERNYQELKREREKERERRTQLTARLRKAREKEEEP